MTAMPMKTEAEIKDALNKAVTATEHLLRTHGLASPDSMTGVGMTAALSWVLGFHSNGVDAIMKVPEEEGLEIIDVASTDIGMYNMFFAPKPKA